MATLIQTWLNFALQQMAAESYLDQVLSAGRKRCQEPLSGLAA